MALSAVLPKNEHSERNLAFTVLCVTLLSTLAMVIYPVVAKALGLGPAHTGVFLGGTIHDVAQVIGAGFSVSDEAGETATLVKLLRVVMLAPVVFILSVLVRAQATIHQEETLRRPIIPAFIFAFIGLALLNSIGVFPEFVGHFVSEISRWALLTSIAAVGMRTSIKRVLDVGWQALVVIIAETAFLGALVVLGLFYIA